MQPDVSTAGIGISGDVGAFLSRPIAVRRAMVAGSARNAISLSPCSSGAGASQTCCLFGAPVVRVGSNIEVGYVHLLLGLPYPGGFMIMLRFCVSWGCVRNNSSACPACLKICFQLHSQ